MVGSPKTLTDLRKIDAGVRVTCNGCGRSTILDREKLIEDLVRRQRNLAWSLLPRYFRCSAKECGSKDVTLRPEPFAGRQIGGEELVEQFVRAADRLIFALRASGAATPELLAMADARAAFEQAKRDLLAWVADRSSEKPGLIRR